MNKKNYYILNNGILKRKENTVYFTNKDENKVIPINKIYSIYAYGQVSFSSQVINLLAKKGILLHFFNYYGYYNGSFYPHESFLSGNIIIKQSEFYLDYIKRLNLSKLFVLGSSKNILKVLSYYNMDSNIKNTLKELSKAKNINEVMNIEARIRMEYYSKFDNILPLNFQFHKRSKHPPKNMVNSLISFGNSMMYSTVLTELYNTQLNPTISYLHEPSDRRNSLTFDLSEIFKPIFVDRLIFYLINKKIIRKKDFNQNNNQCYLNDNGKNIFINEYNKRLEKTITPKNMNRKVSYQRLIRLEAYKLKNHILSKETYKPFIIDW